MFSSIEPSLKIKRLPVTKAKKLPRRETSAHWQEAFEYSFTISKSSISIPSLRWDFVLFVTRSTAQRLTSPSNSSCHREQDLLEAQVVLFPEWQGNSTFLASTHLQLSLPQFKKKNLEIFSHARAEAWALLHVSAFVSLQEQAEREPVTDIRTTEGLGNWALRTWTPLTKQVWFPLTRSKGQVLWNSGRKNQSRKSTWIKGSDTAFSETARAC